MLIKWFQGKLNFDVFFTKCSLPKYPGSANVENILFNFLNPEVNLSCSSKMYKLIQNASKLANFETIIEVTVFQKLK